MAMSFFSRCSSASRRSGLDEVLSQLCQDDFIAEELGGLIVNHENVDLLVIVHEYFLFIGHAFQPGPATRHASLHRCSHIRSADSN